MALNYPNRQYKAILVSISQKQAEFLKENGYKPSRILQQAVDTLMNATDRGDLIQVLRESKRRLNNITELALKQKEFIEKQGLLNEFIGVKQ